MTNVKNPPSSQEVSGFSISTLYNSEEIETSSKMTISVKAAVAGVMKFGSQPLKLSDEVIARYNTYTFNVVTNNPVYDGAVVEIVFPDDFDILKVTAVTGSLSMMRSPTYTILVRTLTLKKCFNKYVDINSQYIFTVNAVRNPMSRKTSQVISISVYTESGYLIDKTYVGLTVTAIPGAIVVYGISAAKYVVNSSEMYTVDIQPNEPVMKDAKIRIVVPAEMSISSDRSVQLISGFDASAIPSVQVSSGSLVISNVFPSTIESKRLIFSVSSLKNPNTAVKSSVFSIELCEDSSCVNLISYDYSYTITAVPDTLKSVGVDIIPKITGDIATYTFTIQTTNTIPQGGQLSITLPTYIEVLTTSSPLCTNLKGFSHSITCSYTSSSITISNGFSTDFPTGVLILSVTSLKNPQTTQPTSSFKVSTSLNNAFIDIQESGISITIDNPHTLNEVSLVSEIPVITGATQEYILSISPYNYMPSGGKVVISPPSGYAFSSNIGCLAYGSVTVNTTCSVASDLNITVRFTESLVVSKFQIKLLNVINPISTEETASFKIYTMDGSYFIDKQETGITLKATVAASFPTIVILPESHYIGQSGVYTFQITATVRIPSNGYLHIWFPSSITKAGLSHVCTKDTVEVYCEFISSDILKVFGITLDTPPSTFNIKVTNIQNPSVTGLTSPFKIYSMSNGYTIQQSLDRTLTFTCKDPCATCENLSDNCKSCKSTSLTPYFYDDSCNAVCKDGYSDLGGFTCSKCADKCKTCRINSSTCSSCYKSGSYPLLYNGSCVDVCPDGYLMSLDLECIQCSGSCKTCVNTLTHCTSCLTNLVLYNNSCMSSCPANTTIQSGLDCKDCSSNCNTCQGTIDICTSCKDTKKLYLTTCVGSCPADITIDLGNTCSLCTNNCKTCRDLTSYCMTCKDGYLLLDNKCIEVCPYGYTAIQGRCEICNSNCIACSGDVNYCTECKASRYLYNNSCLEVCPENITVQTLNRCEMCSSVCKTCKVSSSYCTSCSSSTYMYNNSCIDVCPVSTLPIDGSCKSCIDYCKTCKNSLNNCIECKNGYNLYNNICVSACPPATLLLSNSCQNCSEGCSVCQNSVDNCLQCMNGWYLSGQLCVKTCPDGYVGINKVCQKCEETCQKCEESVSKCVECKSEYYFYQNKCIDSCPILTIPINGECKACSEPCLSCEESVTYCKSCSSSWNLYGRTCLSSCPSGYVGISGVCKECTYPCITCSNTQQYCLSCINELIPFAGSCIEECPSGYQLLQGKCVEESPIIPDCSTGCTKEKLQNSNCDADCNVPACAYDGGNCPITNPDCALGCTVVKLLNSVCDPECNLIACGYDARKCANGSDCAIGCTSDLLYNNVCDESCNVLACNFDDGKCSAAPECAEGCNQKLLNNERCDEVCNVSSCAFDNGYCETELECGEGCTEELLMNGVCDKVCNVSSCQFDYGTCKIEEECSLGCTADLLENERCDEVCNVSSCGFDNLTCEEDTPEIIAKSYDDDIHIEEDPVPFTICSVALGVILIVVKFISGGTVLLSSLIPCWSMAYTAAWWGTLSLLTQISTTHGRELMDLEDEKIMAISILLMSLLFLQYVTNIIFLFLYLKISKKDEVHRSWSRKFRYTYISCILLSVLCSFQCIKLSYSGLFNRDNFKAGFEKWSSIYKPLSQLSYISLILITVPMIITLSYIILEFSKGNVVWLMALDCLVIAVLVAVLTVVDQVNMAKAVGREDQKIELESSMNMKGLNDETVLEMDNRWGNHLCVVSEKVSEEDERSEEENGAMNLLYTGKIENTYQEPESECGDGKNENGPKSTHEMEEEVSLFTQNTKELMDAFTEIDNEIKQETARNLFQVDKLDNYEIILEATPLSPKLENSEILLNSLVKDYKIDKLDNYEFPPTPRIRHFTIDKPDDSEIELEDTKFTPTRSYAIDQTHSFHIQNNQKPRLFEVDKQKEFGVFFSPVKKYSIETTPVYEISSYIPQEEEPSDIPEDICIDDNPIYEILLSEIKEETEIDLSHAEVDPDDLRKIKVKHLATDNVVLIDHDPLGVLVLDSHGNMIQNHSYNLREYEIESVNAQNVRFATLRRMGKPYDRISVVREFKGARIVDLEMKGENGWLIGKTVINEEDFDFSSAIIDSKNKDIVTVPHIKTGKLAKIRKGFNLTGNHNLSDVEIDPDDIHLGRIYDGNNEVVYIRSFIGAKIVDLLPNILPYITLPSFNLTPRAKTSQEFRRQPSESDDDIIHEDHGKFNFESDSSESSDISYFDYEPEPNPFNMTPDEDNPYFSFSRQNFRKSPKKIKKKRKKELRTIYLQRLDIPRIALEKQQKRARTRVGRHRNIFLEGSIDDFIRTEFPRIPY